SRERRPVHPRGARPAARRPGSPRRTAGRTRQGRRAVSLLEVRTLTDGGQQAETVAGWIAEYLDGAQHTLDVALYDLRVDGPAEPTIVDAFHRALQRGVQGRLVYNVDHEKPIPVPPPPDTDVGMLEACGLPTRSVPGIPDLMHHKYVVRDGAQVWTG